MTVWQTNERGEGQPAEDCDHEFVETDTNPSYWRCECGAVRDREPE